MSGQVDAIRPFEIPERRSPSPAQYGEGFEAFGEMILACAEKMNLAARFYVPSKMFLRYAEDYLQLCKRVEEASKGVLKLRSIVEIEQPEAISIVLEKIKSQ